MQNAIMYRNTINQILDELPEEKLAEIFDFAVFIREKIKTASIHTAKPVIKAVPASQLQALSGSVAWGGNALDDTERLYE